MGRVRRNDQSPTQPVSDGRACISTVYCCPALPVDEETTLRAISACPLRIRARHLPAKLIPPLETRYLCRLPACLPGYLVSPSSSPCTPNSRHHPSRSRPATVLDGPVGAAHSIAETSRRRASPSPYGRPSLPSAHSRQPKLRARAASKSPLFVSAV